jgi:acetoin utilization deacetylase AcuC-like enzyme
MRVVYDPSHILHDPVTEVQYGVAIPMYEVPARVESIHAALLADDEFSFADPAGHGLGPVTAVHHEGLVRFLAEAWSLWLAHGGGSDSLPSQFMPDTVLHPAMREGMGEAPEPSGEHRGLLRGRTTGGESRLADARPAGGRVLCPPARR